MIGPEYQWRLTGPVMRPVFAPLCELGGMTKGFESVNSFHQLCAQA